jgi:hypothetical protein
MYNVRCPLYIVPVLWIARVSHAAFAALHYPAVDRKAMERDRRIDRDVGIQTLSI